MEKIKVLILLLLVLFAEISHAQNYGRKPFVHKGLMYMSTGLTGGIMTFNQVQDIYFTGSFSYLVEEQIGIRTDINVFLPDYNFEGQLQKNSSLLLGPEFHFPAGRFDMSLIFEPGISFANLEGGTADKKTQAEPVFLASMGFYYYILQNFHVLASVGYLHGNYFLESSDPFRLDELRLTGGLGINIFVNHQAAFNRKRVKF
jgi:hypothetical protein